MRKGSSVRLVQGWGEGVKGWEGWWSGKFVQGWGEGVKGWEGKTNIFKSLKLLKFLKVISLYGVETIEIEFT